MIRRRPVFSVAPVAVAGILILASGCAEHSPTAVELKPEAGPSSSSIGRSVETLNTGTAPKFNQLVLGAG